MTTIDFARKVIKDFATANKLDYTEGRKFDDATDEIVDALTYLFDIESEDSFVAMEAEMDDDNRGLLEEDNESET